MSTPTTEPRGSARTSPGRDRSQAHPGLARSWPTRRPRYSSGSAPTTRPTTSRSPTCTPSCFRQPTAPLRFAPPSRAEMAAATPSGRRQARRGRSDPPRALAVRGAPRRDPARVGRHGRLVPRGRRGLQPPPPPRRTRIDILASSRHVRIEVDGVTVAESTSHACSWRPDYPSVTTCPSRTSAWTCSSQPTASATARTRAAPSGGRDGAGDSVHRDLAWSYRAPLAESQKIAGLVSLYDEKVDVYVDGVLQERPSTKFS